MKVESQSEVLTVEELQNVALKSCACPRGFRKHLGSHFHCRLCETTSRYSHKILQHEYEVHQNAALNQRSLAVDESRVMTPSTTTAGAESSTRVHDADDSSTGKLTTDDISSAVKVEASIDCDNGESSWAESYFQVWL